VKILKILHFDDYEDLVITVSEKYDEVKKNDDLDSIDVVGKYEDIKEIMANLITFGYGIALITDFAYPSWDNYEDEFILSINDNEVWCEPAKRDNGYIYSEAKAVYLLDDCNSKIISQIEADEIYEVAIGGCDDECDNCACMSGTDDTYVHLSNDEDGNTHGFTASKSDGSSYVSYSYYTSDELTENDIQKMLKAFGF
jgi:hypothetical protein